MARLARLQISLLLVPVVLSLGGCNATETAAGDPGQAAEYELPGASAEFGIGPVIRASADPVAENARQLLVTVSLSRAARHEVHVNYMTADGTAVQGDDYQRAKGRLTFKPGETSKTIPLALADDKAAEGDETFVLRLHAAGDVTMESAEVSLTIVDDDSS